MFKPPTRQDSLVLSCPCRLCELDITYTNTIECYLPVCSNVVITKTLIVSIQLKHVINVSFISLDMPYTVERCYRI